MKKRLLSTLLALCMALSLLTASALAADSHPCGKNLTYTFDNGVLTIEGTGPMWDMLGVNGGSPSWGGSGTSSVIIGDGATSIGSYAFYGCRNLTGITIPASVTSIEASAFSECYSLVNVYYGGSESQWKQLTAEVRDQELLDATIHYNSANGTIPERPALPVSDENFRIGEAILWEYLGSDSEVTIPNGVAVIGGDAFEGNTNLTSVTFPNSVVTIRPNAFDGCVNLTSVILSNRLTGIGGEAFKNCAGLKSIALPARVNSIGYHAFLGCTGLTDIYYGGSESQWEQIYIDKMDEGNAPLLNATIHYNSAGGTAPAEPETPAPTPDTPAAPAGGTAYASTQTVELDGKKVEFQMYALKEANGGLTNYVKVRDLAFALNGTKAQFSVDWDGQVNLVAGEAYEPNGSENSTPFSGDRAYTVPTSPTNVNGEASDLAAITLTDDNGGNYNYYKLRDLGQKLGFNVDWTAERGVFIETDKPYGG